MDPEAVANYEVVVAKYKEDVSWTNDLPEDFSVIVYDKSCDRPNVGREAETWLYHIIENYEHLADVTVFLQGNPFDHMNVSRQIFYQELRNLCRLATTDRKVLPVFQSYHTEPVGKHGLPSAFHFHQIFGPSESVPSTFAFSPGAQYCVSREALRTRDIEFYETLKDKTTFIGFDISLEEVVRRGIKPDPRFLDAWTLERFWPQLWKAHTTMKPTCPTTAFLGFPAKL